MNDKNLVPGSVFGGMLLISGSCIGAGMLGLPVLLGLCGFWPSLILIASSWLFMTFNGLLMVEINGWFYERVNIISMVGASIGRIGKIISWILYLFLFYSLLVAYVAGSGKIFSSYLPFSSQTSSIIFVLIASIIIYAGTKPVDFVNRIFMAGLIVSYIGMIMLGIFKVSSSFFSYVDMKYFFLPLPVMVISFGFHNMIPSLTAYMKGDLRRTKQSIIGGSLISLLIYFFWIIFVLGVVPVEGVNGLMNSYLEGNEATIALKNILKSGSVLVFSNLFAIFAIITSMITQGLGLMHFIADGLKVKLNNKNNLWLLALAILPPTIFSIVYPKIFFAALGFAGAYFAVILFGIFPAMMAWIGRYLKNESSSYHVKGGKISLILAMAFSLIIILSQFINSLR